MSNNILAKHQELSDSPFDSIRHLDDQGNEFWYARDLMPLLGYLKWERFSGSIDRAKIACQNSGNVVAEHIFPEAGKSITKPKDDFRLSRLACYLVAMNGDPRKPEIASAQSYFAVKTRQAETMTEPALPELSRLEILRMALDSEEKRIEAEKKLAIASEQIEVMAPLAKLGKCMTTHEKDTKTIGEIAQSYNMGRNTLFSILRKINFIQQGSTRPYQHHIDAGHCEVKLVSRPHNAGRLDPVCVITMKGQAYIAKRLTELEQRDRTEVLLERSVNLL